MTTTCFVLQPVGRSSRERAMQAVEYYNSSVLRARAGAGLVGPGRAGHCPPPHHAPHGGHGGHGRHHAGSVGAGPHGSHTGLGMAGNDILYRSNSSLELTPDHGHHQHHQGE